MSTPVDVNQLGSLNPTYGAVYPEFTIMKHEEIEVRRSSRKSVVSAAKVFHLDGDEIETLKVRCWQPPNK